MTTAEKVAALLAADFYRTAPRAEVVEQQVGQRGYAKSKMKLAQEIVELVLNEASLSERLQASQAVIDRRGD